MYMTQHDDNIIPFDQIIDQPTGHSTDDSTVTTTNDSTTMKDNLVQVRQRYDAIMTLIEHVNVMITSWLDGVDTYTADDLGVVERMCNSMEDALYLSVDERPEDHRE